jgi:hypothetical protein
MIPVNTSTKTDNPKIVFAGVDAGAKIFVELNGEPAGSAAAAAATYQKKNANTCSTPRMTECFSFRIAMIPAFICWQPGSNNRSVIGRLLLGSTAGNAQLTLWGYYGLGPQWHAKTNRFRDAFNAPMLQSVISKALPKGADFRKDADHS